MATPPTSDVLPDAAATNWVDRSAPEALKPWLKLGRFDRPIGIWLLLLPGWQGIALAAAISGDLMSHGLWYLWLCLLFAVGAALMRAAGCAWNDIVDRDIDARVSRTANRPIPAGRISVKQALTFIAVCCVVSLAILLSFNLVAVAVGAASLLLVAAYPFMKRLTWWPQAWLGLTFNWGVLLGVAAAAGGLSVLDYLVMAAGGDGPALSGDARPIAWIPALLLYASGVFWTLGYDTIYALQDIEDDAMVGVKSSARRLGARAREGVAVFYVLAATLALVSWWTAKLGEGFLLPWALFALHLALQVRSLRLGDSPLALKLFKSNREAGLMLVLAFAAGIWSLP